MTSCFEISALSISLKVLSWCASPAAKLKLEIGPCTNPKRLTRRLRYLILRSRLLNISSFPSLPSSIASKSSPHHCSHRLYKTRDWHSRIPNVFYARVLSDPMALTNYNRMTPYRDSKYPYSRKPYRETMLLFYFTSSIFGWDRLSRISKPGKHDCLCTKRKRAAHDFIPSHLHAVQLTNP